jgi:hypothetical protein
MLADDEYVKIYNIYKQIKNGHAGEPEEESKKKLVCKCQEWSYACRTVEEINICIHKNTIQEVLPVINHILPNQEHIIKLDIIHQDSSGTTCMAIANDIQIIQIISLVSRLIETITDQITKFCTGIGIINGVLGHFMNGNLDNLDNKSKLLLIHTVSKKTKNIVDGLNACNKKCQDTIEHKFNGRFLEIKDKINLWPRYIDNLINKYTN